jgi:hypothetical protein
VVEEDGKLMVKYVKEVGKPKVERRVERKPPPVVRTYEEGLPEYLRGVYRRWMELLRS